MCFRCVLHPVAWVASSSSAHSFESRSICRQLYGQQASAANFMRFAHKPTSQASPATAMRWCVLEQHVPSGPSQRPKGSDAVQVNNGSYDPGNLPITTLLSPTGPLFVGKTNVTLTVANDYGSSNCTASVTVMVRMAAHPG